MRMASTPLLMSDGEAAATAFTPVRCFPYPSGNLQHGAHVAQLCDSTDLIARSAVAGRQVLQPDGLGRLRGLRRRNAAIERWNRSRATGPTPNIARCGAQLQRLGLSIDWDREVATATAGLLPLDPVAVLQSTGGPGLPQGTTGQLGSDRSDGWPMNRWIAEGRSWRSGAKVEKRQAAPMRSCASPTTPRLCSIGPSTSSMAGPSGRAHDAGQTGSAVGWAPSCTSKIMAPAWSRQTQRQASQVDHGLHHPPRHILLGELPGAGSGSNPWWRSHRPLSTPDAVEGLL